MIFVLKKKNLSNSAQIDSEPAQPEVINCEIFSLFCELSFSAQWKILPAQIIDSPPILKPKNLPTSYSIWPIFSHECATWDSNTKRSLVTAAAFLFIPHRFASGSQKSRWRRIRRTYLPTLETWVHNTLLGGKLLWQRSTLSIWPNCSNIAPLTWRNSRTPLAQRI